MKAYLICNLPEDELELSQAQNAGKVLLGINELNEFLRSCYKYEDKNWVKIEYIRSVLWKLENGGMDIEPPSNEDVKA